MAELVTRESMQHDAVQRMPTQRGSIQRSDVLAFIASEKKRPWQPGTVDCCVVLATWAMRLGHPDPIPEYRNTYHDEDGLNALIDGAGGPLPFVTVAAERIGGKRISEPICGAIGVIGSATNPRRQFGAIFDGRRWRVRMVNDYGAVCARPLAIWDISHDRTRANPADRVVARHDGDCG